MTNIEGEQHSEQLPEPLQEGLPKTTRRQFINRFGPTIAAALISSNIAFPVVINARDKQWRQILQGVSDEITTLNQSLEAARQATNPDRLRYGRGTIVTGKELAPNGTFDKEKNATETNGILGWTSLPDEDPFRAPSWAGPNKSGERYIAIRNDSQNPDAQQNYYWQSDTITIDPRKSYAAAFSTACFKDELPNPYSIAPTLNFLFFNREGEIIKEQRAYLQWLAINPSNIWNRVITTIGEGHTDISPAVPSETIAIKLRFGATNEQDLRFRKNETRFTDISVRELGYEPQKPKDTLGRPV